GCNSSGHDQRHRRAQVPRRGRDRRERVEARHAGRHRHVRRGHRRRPVHPRRSRAGQGDAVRRHDRARLLHAVPRAALLVRPLQARRRRVRAELRPQQAPLPRAASGRQAGAHAPRDPERRRHPRRCADHDALHVRGRGRREAGRRRRGAEPCLHRL
ncbi:MAG: Acyl dehydratase, partial [uncultured Solirubrobacteraceae bacterium]